MSKRIGLVVVFLVGCATGGVSSQFVVRKANAQQAATLTKWQYECIRETGAYAVTAKANQLGAEGWEMMTVDSDVTKSGEGSVWCFKRPKL